MPSAERYHREDFVSQQIENWLGYSPSNASRGLAMVEELGQLIDLNRAHTVIPRDATSAERTSHALDALDQQHRQALMLYHTKRTLTLRQMAGALKVGKTTVDRLLTRSHFLFVNGWDEAKFKAILGGTNGLGTRASASVCENVRIGVGQTDIVFPILRQVVTQSDGDRGNTDDGTPKNPRVLPADQPSGA